MTTGGLHRLRARLACACLLALALTLGAGPLHAQGVRATTAQRAALDWLALVDHGDYEASWKAASAKFRKVTGAAEWSRTIAAQRNPRGAVVQRTMMNTSFRTSFPGAPEGDYALIVFRTAFANRTDGGETVTLEHEPDGMWRVIGYVIR